MRVAVAVAAVAVLVVGCMLIAAVVGGRVGVLVLVLLQGLQMKGIGSTYSIGSAKLSQLPVSAMRVHEWMHLHG